MGTMRHWKQYWDPKAPLIFTRRLNLGLPCKMVAMPGDEVTPEIRAALGKSEAHQLAKLRRWWEANYLAIKDWKAPSEARWAKSEPPTAPAPAGITQLGRGWFKVAMPDGTTRTVRGQKAAEDALAAVKA